MKYNFIPDQTQTEGMIIELWQNIHTLMVDQQVILQLLVRNVKYAQLKKLII